MVHWFINVQGLFVYFIRMKYGCIYRHYSFTGEVLK